MKLNTVRVKDLGAIRDAEIPGAPVVLFLGENEAGKSTLLDALEVLYFGTRGRVPVKENKQLTRDGAKSWSVEAVLEGVKEPLRATPSQRPLRKQLEQHFGDPRVWQALGDLGYWLGMSPARRRELFADLVARDTQGLVDLLTSESCPQEIVRLISEGHLKTAHNQLLQQRRTSSRWVQDLEVTAAEEPEAPMVPTKGGDRPVDKVPLDQVQAAVRKLEQQLGELQSATGARRQYDFVKADADQAREELERMSADASWEDEDERAYAKVQRAAEACRKEIANAVAALAHWGREADRLADLGKHGGDCPTCGAGLESAAGKKRVKALRDAAQAAVQEHKQLQTKKADEAKQLDERLKEMRARREQVAQSRTYRARLESRIATFEELEEPATTRLKPEDVQEQLDRLRRIERARLAYDHAVKQHQEAKDRLDQAKEREATWRRWEELTDPSKLEDETALQGFREALAESSKRLLGGEDQVTLDDAFNVSIRGRDPSLASDSESIRAGAACSIALARVAGVGFLAVDRFESLDDDGRRAFLTAAKYAVDQGWLAHVWVAAVKKDPKAGANVPWLAWVKVEKGATIPMNGRA